MLCESKAQKERQKRMQAVRRYGEKATMIKEIIAETARVYSITEWDIIESRSMKRDITEPRMMAMYISRLVGDKSYPIIARYFNRDHTTIMHSWRHMPKRIEKDDEMRDRFNTIARVALDHKKERQQLSPSLIFTKTT